MTTWLYSHQQGDDDDIDVILHSKFQVGFMAFG